MNILFISKFINPTIGGVARVTVALSNEFTQKEQNCFYIYWDGDTGNISEDKCMFLSPNSCDFIIKSQEFIREKSIDLIINQDNYEEGIIKLLSVEQKKRKRLINVLHLSPEFLQNIKLTGIKLIIKNFIFKLLYGHGIIIKQRKDMYNLVDKFILLSSSYINDFKHIYKIKDDTKFYAIGNPIPFDKVAVDFTMKEKIVTIVSRLEDNQKNISAALRIWKEVEKKHKSWKLIIAGQGEDEYMLKKYANSLYLKNIEFTGKLNNPQTLYLKSSIFMMTSRYEGYPMTLLEAIQCGCIPIVYNSFSALHDLIVDGENGFIIENGNRSMFVKQINKLMSDKTMRYKMFKNTLTSANLHSADSIANEWLNMIKNL